MNTHILMKNNDLLLALIFNNLYNPIKNKIFTIINRSY